MDKQEILHILTVLNHSLSSQKDTLTTAISKTEEINQEALVSKLDDIKYEVDRAYSTVEDAKVHVSELESKLYGLDIANILLKLESADSDVTSAITLVHNMKDAIESMTEKSELVDETKPIKIGDTIIGYAVLVKQVPTNSSTLVAEVMSEQPASTPVVLQPIEKQVVDDLSRIGWEDIAHASFMGGKVVLYTRLVGVVTQVSLIFMQGDDNIRHDLAKDAKALGARENLLIELAGVLEDKIKDNRQSVKIVFRVLMKGMFELIYEPDKQEQVAAPLLEEEVDNSSSLKHSYDWRVIASWPIGDASIVCKTNHNDIGEYGANYIFYSADGDRMNARTAVSNKLISKSVWESLMSREGGLFISLLGCDKHDAEALRKEYIGILDIFYEDNKSPDAVMIREVTAPIAESSEPNDELRECDDEFDTSVRIGSVRLANNTMIHLRYSEQNNNYVYFFYFAPSCRRVRMDKLSAHELGNLDITYTMLEGARAIFEDISVNISRSISPEVANALMKDYAHYKIEFLRIETEKQSSDEGDCADAGNTYGEHDYFLLVTTKYGEIRLFVSKIGDKKVITVLQNIAGDSIVINRNAKYCSINALKLLIEAFSNEATDGSYQSLLMDEKDTYIDVAHSADHHFEDKEVLLLLRSLLDSTNSNEPQHV